MHNSPEMIIDKNFDFCKTIHIMNRTKRAKIITCLLDEMRKDIVITNEFQLMRLEILKRMELGAIEENSDHAVKKIKKYVEQQKQNIREYPALKLKSQTIDGKMIIYNL